jgi:endoglycosylceramidase
MRRYFIFSGLFFLSMVVFPTIVIAEGGKGEFYVRSEGIPRLHAGEDYIYDDHGRVVLLRGVNVPCHHNNPCQFMPSDLDVIRGFGFNFIRLGVSWSYGEPREGEYDQDYIESVIDLAEDAGRRGIYVMPEVHQVGFCAPGSGIPQWVCKDPPKNKADFLDIAAEAYRFWDSSSLQEHLINYWAYLAERFQSLDNLFGYNIMNEPVSPECFIPGLFEKKLFPFYERCIDEIRRVNPEATVIVEPCVFDIMFPAKTRPLAHSNIVYSTHPYFFHLYTGKGKLVVAEKESPEGLSKKFRRHVREAELMSAPLLVGEFGGPEQYEFAEEWLDECFGLMDEYFLGFAIWVYSPGDWNWTIVDDDRKPRQFYWPHLHRPYPRYTSGRPVHLYYSYEEGKFSYRYKPLEKEFLPTEIYIPHEFMENSLVEVSGGRREYDEGEEVMCIFSDAGAGEVQVELSPEIRE